MNQDGRSPSGRPHPPWCALTDDEHDPHESARQRIGEEHPSDTTIEAYLIQLDQRSLVEPFAAIEFNYPGDETAAYLLTLGQLRRFGEAASGLLETAQQS
jgi:hypothetical protein